jgi:PPOX class probable F420-dependent enzyme
MPELNEQHRKFLSEPHFGIVTTLRADGSPHSTVVWVDVDDDGVVYNTQAGRTKADNVERDPRAAVLVIDAEDSGRWIAVDGPVEVTSEGAREHADELAVKYTGAAFTGPTENRLIVRITPAHVTAFGLD